MVKAAKTERDAGMLSPKMSFDLHEIAGSLADLGIFVPIAIALIVGNGLSATAVLLSAGMLLISVALRFRLPIPVQPLKAFGAIAIAEGLGVGEIAAGAILMGVIFVALSATGLIDWGARTFPLPVIRGIQLAVGLLLLRVAVKLIMEPSPVWTDASASTLMMGTAAGAVLIATLILRTYAITVLVVVGGIVLALVRTGFPVELGPTAIHIPSLTPSMFWSALVLLVIPQVPLTFANSCVATADAARTYFGDKAERVTAGRLAMSLGIANLLAGFMGGLPMCHGAGGLTAHRSFGARTGGAPLMLGAAFIGIAVVFGAALTTVLAAFPLWILAGMLLSVGLLHIALLKDLAGSQAWIFAVLVGVTGFLTNLAIAVVIALAAWWALQRFQQPQSSQ